MEPATQLTLLPRPGLDSRRRSAIGHERHAMPTHEDTLRERFGLPSFRPWQREAIEALLDGDGRVLVVAPTGGGKSLCYQFPATVLEGTTIVVSPLIALMDDQVRSLEERGIAATYLASTLAPEERRRRERGLSEGAYRLVYVAPERLRSGYLMNQLARLRPPLLAIDEAHCISQWGHDFRPDYLRLGEVLAELRPARVLACTATATPLVRDEILERLNLRDDRTKVVLRGFARPNLHLEVEELDGITARRRVVKKKLSEVLGGPGREGGAAIIYAGTRKNTERIAAAFADDGWRCSAYHAGIEAPVREQVSAAFSAGELELVVATNAFGMGIDRPDIRLVAHTQAPGSIEQYYQEVGRAGRDGEAAFGLLLAGSSDFAFRRRLIELGEGDEALSERQWHMFLDLMRYVEAGSCRHDFILRYFGDEGEVLGGCGHCDVCALLDAGALDPTITEEDTLTVRKALSAVARLKRRAGLTILAQSLHGDDNQRIRQLGLDALSTHGLLRDHPVAWITSLLRRLMTAALIELTPSDYPVPYLTAAGREVMKGEKPVRLILPPHPAARRKGTKKREPRASEVTGVDPALFERLRSARMEAAKEKGVPAYVVCHNRSLEEMAARRPINLDSLADVYGMGPARIEAYGERFLAVIRTAPPVL